MTGLLVGLILLLTTAAQAVCPASGTFVPQGGGTFTGNTCGHANVYFPHTATYNGSPDDLYVWIAPPGPYQVTLQGFPGSVVEVRDFQDGTCDKAVYGACRPLGAQACTIDDNAYTGFDAPRWLGIFVDGIYRGCGPYTLTIGPYVEE